MAGVYPMLGLMFCGLYAAFMTGLAVLVPGYVERVWNLPDLSGVMIAGIPSRSLHSDSRSEGTGQMCTSTLHG